VELRRVIREELEAALRRAEREPGRVERSYVEERAWLSSADVMALTGWGRDKIEALRKAGELPMFKDPNGKDYRMTRAAFEAFERRAQTKWVRPEARYRARLRE
jgi:hypothetical protein